MEKAPTINDDLNEICKNILNAKIDGKYKNKFRSKRIKQ
jgi:hypothetical protein